MKTRFFFLLPALFLIGCMPTVNVESDGIPAPKQKVQIEGPRLTIRSTVDFPVTVDVLGVPRELGPGRYANITVPVWGLPKDGGCMTIPVIISAVGHGGMTRTWYVCSMSPQSAAWVLGASGNYLFLN